VTITKAQLQQYTKSVPWRPQPGPQTEAYWSDADITLYGGAAGGGKSSLAVGLALCQHREILYIRREAKQLGGVLDHIAELVDPTRSGYSGQSGEWKIPPWDGIKRKIVLGSTKNMGDEMKFQGRPRDLLVIDEAANMLRSQVEFLQGWVRTTTPGQRTRTLLCSNPPVNSEGFWLTEMFDAWLDPNHANPAGPGELRWYLTTAGKRTPVDAGDPVKNLSPHSDDDEWLYPKSYTFIPAKVGDNKYLGKEYLRELQALPSPLREQMLFGDFTAGKEDNEWQVIPSDWVEEAQNRWEERLFNPLKIVSAGLDPSRGGRDSTVLACREDWHYHELQQWPGHEVPDGQTVAAKVIELLGISPCPVHTDVIGIGASVVDILKMYIHSRVVPINVAESAKDETDWSGTLKFGNKRAQLWWQFRDILNPANGFNVSLPRDQQLKAELCSPTYQLKASGIMIESKQELIRRLGRSTDKADAVIMAAERTAILNMTGLSGRIQVNR